MSSVGGGRRRVNGGGREGGVKERGRAKARGRPNRRRAEAASWIASDNRLGEATVSERVREREERVRKLKSKIDYEGKRECVLISNKRNNSII